MIARTMISPYSSAATAMMKSVCASGSDHFTVPSLLHADAEDAAFLDRVGRVADLGARVDLGRQELMSIRRAKCPDAL